jgi:hypothetical protein
MTDTPQAARRYLAKIGRKGGSVKGKRNATETGQKAAAKRWTLERRIDALVKAGDVLAEGHRVPVAQEYVVAALDAWAKAKEAQL